MSYESNEDAQRAAVQFVGDLGRGIDELLGTRLYGVYRIGSLAHAGFSRRYSDVDIAIVAAGGLAQTDLDAIRDSAAGLSPDWAPKLSIFWSDETFSMGRFPPLDRLDLIEHGVAVIERQALRPARPLLPEIRAYLAGAPLTNWANVAGLYAGASEFAAKDRKAYLRAHLYPARFALSWLAGRIASNDDAVAFLRSSPPPGLDVGLVEEALRIRQAGLDPDSLFARRMALPAQVEACRGLMAGAN